VHPAGPFALYPRPVGAPGRRNPRAEAQHEARRGFEVRLRETIGAQRADLAGDRQGGRRQRVHVDPAGIPVPAQLAEAELAFFVEHVDNFAMQRLGGETAIG